MLCFVLPDSIDGHNYTEKTKVWNYHLKLPQRLCELAQCLGLTTMLWLNGVGLAPGRSGTGWRKSYSRRINRDKLNNCAVVRGATTAQHKHWTDSLPYGHQHNINCVFSCQLLTAACWLYSIVCVCVWLCLMGAQVYRRLHAVGISLSISNVLFVIYVFLTCREQHACAWWEPVVS